MILNSLHRQAFRMLAAAAEAERNKSPLAGYYREKAAYYFRVTHCQPMTGDPDQPRLLGLL